MDNERLRECPEKSLLMDRYSAAVAEHNRTTAVTNARMGVMYKGDYERFTKAADTARERAEKLHLDLLAHIADHGC